MKTRALVTPLLTVVGIFGLMGGTSSAKVKVIDTTGAIDVSRSTSLSIQPLTMDTARYVGLPFLSLPVIRINAAREIKRKRKKPGAAAVGATKRNKPQKIVQRPSTSQESQAKNQALGLCAAYTRTTFLEILHLSNPPFLLGRVFPQPNVEFSFVSDRPPPGDPVRAVQLATSFGGAPVATVGPFEWQVFCSAIQTDTIAP